MFIDLLLEPVKHHSRGQGKHRTRRAASVGEPAADPNISSAFLRFLFGGGPESGVGHRPGRSAASGPSAQPAEHPGRGDPQTGPPHPRVPAPSAAGAAVCDGLCVGRVRRQGAGNPEELRFLLLCSGYLNPSFLTAATRMHKSSEEPEAVGHPEDSGLL